MNRIAYVLSAGLVVAIGIGGGAQAHAQSLYNYSYSSSHCSVNGYGFCGVSDGYGYGSGGLAAQNGMHYVNGQLYDGNGVFVYTGVNGTGSNSYGISASAVTSNDFNNGNRPSISTDPLDPHYYLNGRWYDANGTLDYTGIDQYSGYNYEQSSGYPSVYGNVNYGNTYGYGSYGQNFGNYGWYGNYGG